MPIQGSTSRRRKISRASSARSNAFTLIELLVVIGIISVLLAILVPALSMVRQQTQTTKCLSNLRQIGVAISGYADDHNFCLVPADYYFVNGLFSPYGGGSWVDTLADQFYLNVPIGHIRWPGDFPARFDDLYDRENVLVCPTGMDEDMIEHGFPVTQSDPRGMMFTARSSDVTLEAVRTWYAVNAAPFQEAQSLRPLPFNVLPDFIGAKQDWRVNRITQFSNDSSLPLVFDGVWMFGDDPARINARHGNKTQTNILFADWHCETQVTASLPNDRWYLR